MKRYGYDVDALSTVPEVAARLKLSEYDVEGCLSLRKFDYPVVASLCRHMKLPIAMLFAETNGKQGSFIAMYPYEGGDPVYLALPNDAALLGANPCDLFYLRQVDESGRPTIYVGTRNPGAYIAGELYVLEDEVEVMIMRCERLNGSRSAVFSGGTPLRRVEVARSSLRLATMTAGDEASTFPPPSVTGRLLLTVQAAA